MRVDAEDRIVVHAQHGQLLRNAHLAACACAQDDVGAMVVRGEDRRRLGQRIQPDAQLFRVFPDISRKDAHATPSEPTQFACEKRPTIARPGTVGKGAHEAERRIFADCGKMSRRRTADQLRIDGEKGPARALAPNAQVVRQVKPHHGNVMLGQEPQHILGEVRFVAHDSRTEIHPADDARHIFYRKVPEKLRAERMTDDAQIPRRPGLVQVAHHAVVLVHPLAVGERQRHNNQRQFRTSRTSQTSRTSRTSQTSQGSTLKSGM